MIAGWRRPDPGCAKRARSFGRSHVALAGAVCAGMLLGSGIAEAEPGAGDAAASVASMTREAICLMVEAAARDRGVPPAFMLRLIWKESSFDPGARGPVTRSGARAGGIAQFMPATAEERGLLDPFDPVQALPKSAEFLSELHAAFGNWGLAAAAYNAGPRRVQDWLDGKGGLPFETQAYVEAITGRAAQDWADERARGPAEPAPPDDPGEVRCDQLEVTLSHAPGPFLAALEERVKAAAVSPWGVQLAAGFSRLRVLAAYGRIEGRFRTALAGQDPVIFRLKLRSRGTRDFYEIRAGAPSRAAAEGVCGLIRRSGGACMVLRNASPAGGVARG